MNSASFWDNRDVSPSPNSGHPTAPTVPPILGQIPLGTRPHRYACMVISREALRSSDAVDFAREQMIRSAGERPHVLKLVDEISAHAEFGVSISTPHPSDRALIAVWLEAIPGATEFIVVHPAAGLTETLGQADWDGRWRVRPAGGALMFAGLNGAGEFMQVQATATGRIEINSDGAVAEVYEVRLDDGGWRS